MNIKIKVMLLWFCLAAITVSAQNTYKGTNGKVGFFAEAPFGNIEAESSMVSSTFIDPSGHVAVTIPVKSFVFKKKLMQEHFNEKYMESDKYPEASFTGKIVGMKPIHEMTNQEIDISGTLTIHGQSKPREIKATMSLNTEGELSVKGSFAVQLEDHKIKVPTLLFQKMAETADVKFELLLK